MPEHPIASFIEQHNEREVRRDEGAFSHWMGVNCEIHPNDEIFRFFYHHPSSVNPVRDYLADGWRTLCELMVLLERVDRPLLKTASLLEFASGYGRFTRHLARFMDAQALYAADVMPGSAEFVRERFGVQGFYSSTDPKSLNLPRAFDTVFVLSLFTHLPAATWRSWLERLFAALQPGGALIFSTHGTGFAVRHGIKLNERGYHFIRSSESSTLGAGEYGTTFTSERFVRDAVAALPGARIEQYSADYFWSGQDAWVVSNGAKS
ncbi:MAG: class I SAM-dependent methyltransferase [Chromatiaceae bacterium]|nr:class I SAM-dependent methyltransferase [Chromatiaceae bacterium]